MDITKEISKYSGMVERPLPVNIKVAIGYNDIQEKRLRLNRCLIDPKKMTKG
jgi:hypothetical protein